MVTFESVLPGIHKMSLCLPTRASGLSKQKQKRTILPVHGRTGMVSVLQTISSVIHSIFLLRKGFPWPASCQVVWRKTTAPSNKGHFSAGVKIQQLGCSRAGLPVAGPQPAFPHQDKDHCPFQSQTIPTPQATRISSPPVLE